MARTKTSQRYAAGEKGRNRVWVFPDPKTGMFQIEYRRNGRREARSLKHRDFEKAKEQADKLAANFPSAEPEPEANREPEPLTLGRLFEMYLGEVTPRKSDGVEKFDRAAATRILKCLGTSREPSQLSRREWDLFITARQSARLTGRKVGPRTVGRDLKFLHAVLEGVDKLNEAGHLAASSMQGGVAWPQAAPRPTRQDGADVL